MLSLEYSAQFKKDFKKIAKLPIPDVVEVGHIIKQLQLGEDLSDKYVDHSLAY
jgi:mRNA interferase YafQ